MSTPRTRRALLVAAALPIGVALVLIVVVARMAYQQDRGNDHFAEGAFDAAVEAFTKAGDLNPLQDWVTAFNRGAARHAEGRYDEAVDAYTEALEGVGSEEECTVRINLALAHEALGDAAAQGDDRDTAVAEWEAGLRALRDGDCPSDAGRGPAQSAEAERVEERLERKLEESRRESRRQQQDEQDRQDQRESERERRRQEREERQERREAEQRERELEEQNERGAQGRERFQQDRAPRGYEPSW